MNGHARGGRGAAGLLVVLLLLGLVSGCGTVKEPDPEDWDETARTSLTDAASELATARMTLESQRRDDVWYGYAVVVLADSEEAVGKAEDKVTTLQPPPQRAKVAAKVTSVLATASDVIEKARQTLVAKQPIDDDLMRRLDVLSDRLTHQAEVL